jgi:hypothetical protein
MYVWMVERQPSGHKQPCVVPNLSLKLVVIDWRRKAMKVWDKQVNLKLASVFFCHVYHRQNSTKIIANLQVIISTNTREDGCLCHIQVFSVGSL